MVRAQSSQLSPAYVGRYGEEGRKGRRQTFPEKGRRPKAAELPELSPFSIVLVIGTFDPERRSGRALSFVVNEGDQGTLNGVEAATLRLGRRVHL